MSQDTVQIYPNKVLRDGAILCFLPGANESDVENYTIQSDVICINAFF